MMLRPRNIYWYFFLFAVGLPLAANAEIVQPIAATATSDFFTPPDNLISGLGLIDNGGPVQTQLHNNLEDNGWIANGLASETELEFTLDGNYDLTGMYIWQHNGLDGNGDPNPGRGLKDFEVLVSPDDASPFASAGTFSMVPAMNPLLDPPDGEPAQFFTLSGPDVSNAHRVKFDIIDAQSGPDEMFVGLAEVRFQGALIPEPSALVLLLIGGCLLSRLGRRRNR